MFGMGLGELIIIAIIAILFLGPDKLPETMVQIAKFFKSTKNTINNMKSSFEEEMDVKTMKEEALAYKKELLDAGDKVKSATDIKQMAAKLTTLEDDDFSGIFDAPEKPVAPSVQSKPDEITLPKKKGEETLEKKKIVNMFDEIRPHLIELRKRLAISVGSLIVMFFVMFYFHEPLLAWIVAPLNAALLEVGKISVHAADGMVTTNQVGGAFFVALKVSFFAAIIGALPIILAQIWAFVAPALYANEKKMVLPFIFGGTTMFAIGVMFAYYVVTPFGFDFLITFGSFKFTPLINIEDYVGFFTKIMFGFGIAFELPVFAYTLALLGMVNDRQMIDFFRYAIVIIFIVAAILTPPDVLTQLLMALPLIVLYGISILIVRAVNPASAEEESEEDEDEEDSDTKKLEN